MDTQAQGWLREYCALINSGIPEFEQWSISNYEKAMYRMLQPTGIMYGHPVGNLGSPVQLTNDLDPAGRIKLIFTRSLIRTGSLSLETNYSSMDSSQITDHLVPEIVDYFLNLYPDLYQGNSTSYLKSPYYLAENLIDKRITIQSSLIKNYLTNLFHNSMLFLDVYYFGEWVRGLGSVSSRHINEEKEQLRLTILGTMALAAQADNKLQKEERALLEFFLESANLTSIMEKKARSMFGNMKEFSVEDIPMVDSWLLRKYLMEMAILVTWADKSLHEEEHRFIQRLGSKLEFMPGEISESILAVESFVLDNWSAMHYLLGKHNFEIVGSRFKVRLKGFINKNKDYVIQEIRESKELFYLLGKSRTNKLTNNDKMVINEQLIDILKTIPVFVIIALPFTFITLPILLSLLPKKAFPSAFQE